MYLLEITVALNINELPVVNLLIIILSLITVVFCFFINGVSLKIGDKEINVGGIQKLLAKRDKDTLLKESLKKFTDDVDHETMACLYDLVEDLEDRLEPPLVLGEHCYFTWEKFSSIVKSELYKRIRRNSLWEKLSDVGRDRYITTILKDIENRYTLLRAKTKLVKCGDTYAEFGDIKEAIRGVLSKFFDGTIKILVTGMKKKIKKYKDTKPEFKTVAAMKICCDDCIAKNQFRIKKLTGSFTEVEDDID